MSILLTVECCAVRKIYQLLDTDGLWLLFLISDHGLLFFPTTRANLLESDNTTLKGVLNRHSVARETNN